MPWERVYTKIHGRVRRGNEEDHVLWEELCQRIDDIANEEKYERVVGWREGDLREDH